MGCMSCSWRDSNGLGDAARGIHADASANIAAVVEHEEGGRRYDRSRSEAADGAGQSCLIAALAQRNARYDGSKEDGRSRSRRSAKVIKFSATKDGVGCRAPYR